MKKQLSFLLCFLLLSVLFIVPVSAESEKTEIEINAKSAILTEPNTGKILYEDNADQALPPASITKIMSLLLITEALDNNLFDLETVVTASEHACSMGGSQIWLEPGESMTVDDLLKAAVIVSANDATVALGELVAGSEEAFVSMMNEKAASLGMTKTHFVNCTGLDAEGHLTTAHDVAIMSSALIKHDLIKNYTTVWTDTLRDGKSELVNTNRLVRFYKGTTGLKTGTTSGSGYCLSATAERDGLELVAVVMGAETTGDRFNGAKKLLDFGFANYSYTLISPELKDGLTVQVKKGTLSEIGIVSDDSFGVLLKKSDRAEIKQNLVLNENITAPVKKGDTVGRVEIRLGDEQIGEISVKASDSVEKLTFTKVLNWIFKGLFVL